MNDGVRFCFKSIENSYSKFYPCVFATAFSSYSLKKNRVISQELRLL